MGEAPPDIKDNLVDVTDRYELLGMSAVAHWLGATAIIEETYIDDPVEALREDPTDRDDAESAILDEFDIRARSLFGSVNTERTPFYLGYVAPGKLGLTTDSEAQVTRGDDLDHVALTAWVGEDGKAHLKRERGIGKERQPLSVSEDDWRIVGEALERLADVNKTLTEEQLGQSDD